MSTREAMLIFRQETQPISLRDSAFIAGVVIGSMLGMLAIVVTMGRMIWGI